MNNMTPRTTSELLQDIPGHIIRGDDTRIWRVADLEAAGEGDLAYAGPDDAKLLALAVESKASCLIVPVGSSLTNTFKAKALVEASNPKLAFALVAEILHPPKTREPGIHPSAIISKSAQIGDGVFVGAFVYVGDDSTIDKGTHIRAGAKIGDRVTVGKDCVIHPNVFVEDGVRIGDRVILHAGAVIGADGFGYVRGSDDHQKFPQIGKVEIEDDVEIGANACVDRGSLGCTRIGRGTKIDNLVHVAHNCDIGERVLIAAQTGISGSVTIEDDCIIGGQVGFGDHSRIRSRVIIGSKAGVLSKKVIRLPDDAKDDDDRTFWGVPVQPLKDYKRLNAHLKRVPDMRKELRDLRRRVKELENSLSEETKRSSAKSNS